MTQPFEGIVRPFQLDQVSKPVKVIEPGARPDEPVLLSFGRAGGSGKSMSGSVSLSMSFYCDQQEVEKDTLDFGDG